MELRFQVYGKIAKPVAEVFDAVYNPSKLSGYFTTGGASAPLVEGSTVTWDFADFPGAFPVEVRKVCRLADINNKSLLLQIARQGDQQKMLALVEKIATQGGATREQVRKETQKPKPGRPKAFTFNFRPPTKAFNLRLSFNKKSASKEEIIEALEAILRELRQK